MATISAVVIAQNNAAIIARCVESLAFADEVVVVDGGSADGTAEAASTAGARVVANPWPGYAAQRAFAFAQARGEWILSCDSDEAVSPELAAEVRRVVDASPPENGFWIPRRNYFLGRRIDHGPWARDRVLRLFRRGHGRVTDRPVHEGVEVEGGTGVLTGPMDHYTHPTLAQSVARLNRYTSLEARERAGRRRIRLIDAVVPPAGVFVKYYLVRGTWRDGIHGFLLSAVTAMYKSVLYVKTWLVQQGRDIDTRPGVS